MKVRRTNRFKKDYQNLPEAIQRRVDAKLRFLLRDARHPSLRVHKVQGVEGLWEFSVTMNYRRRAAPKEPDFNRLVSWRWRAENPFERRMRRAISR